MTLKTSLFSVKKYIWHGKKFFLWYLDLTAVLTVRTSRLHRHYSIYKQQNISSVFQRNHLIFQFPISLRKKGGNFFLTRPYLSQRAFSHWTVPTKPEKWEQFTALPICRYWVEDEQYQVRTMKYGWLSASTPFSLQHRNDPRSLSPEIKFKLLVERVQAPLLHYSRADPFDLLKVNADLRAHKVEWPQVRLLTLQLYGYQDWWDPDFVAKCQRALYSRITGLHGYYNARSRRRLKVILPRPRSATFPEVELKNWSIGKDRVVGIKAKIGPAPTYYLRLYPATEIKRVKVFRTWGFNNMLKAIHYLRHESLISPYDENAPGFTE